MKTSTDYSGRQVDIEFLQTITQASGGVTRVTKTVARTPPKVVAGIQKLLQRYTMLLLTPVGSVYGAPTKGTNFVATILRGGGRSDGHIMEAFAFANVAAIDQLRQADADTTYGTVPVDEQIQRATLLDFEVDHATSVLHLGVYVESQAGDSTVFILPVPVPRS